jgi:hypothetical protein
MTVPAQRVAEREEVIDRAHKLRVEVSAAVANVRTAWWVLAERLYEFHELQAWKPLNYQSLDEFLAEPEVGLRRTQYFELVEAYRELVQVRKVRPAELEGVDYSKAMVVVPAIRAQKVGWREALADARELSRSDLRIKYRGNPNAPLDATAEPLIPCPCCGKRGDPRLMKLGARGRP